ncbi:MAG: redoxin family protein [Ardenticatenaceae bacterium]|nr:redoxin family protein [Ardenticatenaceae bacterium]
MKWHYKILTLVLLLLLAACTSQATQTESEPETAVTTSQDNSEDMMDDEAMSDESMEHDDEMMAEDDEAMSDESMEHDDEMMDDETMDDETMMTDLPAWQTIALTDVTTGESFTIADFAGKTVYVEPMATWCTNCRRQLGHVQEARAQLNDENVVFIGISVETNIDDATLAQYTEDTGYDWTFAVATPEMLQSLAEQFGQTITNPPSTPHFIIYPDGTTTDLATGFETADELIPQLQG